MLDQAIFDQLKNFTQFVTFNLLPLYEQKSKGKGKDFWCTDWWTIEVGKYLFNGEETYMGDPPPYRLRDNTNFDKKKIIKDGNVKLATFEALQQVKDSADNLFVCKVGRGLELVLANFVKKWNKVLCYDDNKFYGELLNSYFVNQLRMNIEFTNCSTAKYPFENIRENTILVANGTRINIDEILTNKHIVKAIINGELYGK
jgi:hypothetical protein